MGKRHIAPLAAERVRLRLLDEDDLPRTLAWRNQEHIRRWFFFSDILTAEQHSAWFSRYRNRDDDFVFIIEAHDPAQTTRASSEVRQQECSSTAGRCSRLDEAGAVQLRPVGQVALYDIDWNCGRAEFGRLMIGESDAVGRGLARQATEVVLDLAFRQLGLREVYLDVIPGNVPAIKVYEACGFMIIGSTKKVVSMRKQIAA